MSFHKLDADRFNGLIDRLRQAGFADDDIAWSESVSEPDTAEAFAFETVSVICYAGLRHSVAAGLYCRVVEALRADEGAASVVEDPIKASAIDHVWMNRHSLLTAYQASKNKVEFCGNLPSINDISKFHLAKCLGADVAKPDAHLTKLAKGHGETVQAMCDRLAGQSGLRSTTVDLLLWRACSEQILDPHTGVIHLPQEVRHEA